MNDRYSDKIKKTQNVIKNADYILIGAGAGLSSSAGLLYSGERFIKNFSDFIEKYKLTDMYSSGFYPFKTEEEKWAYWSRHIKLNRWDGDAGKVYSNLHNLIENKKNFVITTNVDGQFYKAGFPHESVFSVQGDYGKFQCAKSCHNTLYDNREIIEEMVRQQVNCRIPTRLVPECPVCGENMEPNIRKDQSFVEDTNWKQASDRYREFVSETNRNNIVLLELGVGYNTPGIIKYPFEQMTMQNDNAVLIRMNKEYPEYSDTNREKTITFSEDISHVIKDII